MPFLFYRIQNAVDDEHPNFALMILQAIFSPSQGKTSTLHLHLYFDTIARFFSEFRTLLMMNLQFMHWWCYKLFFPRWKVKTTCTLASVSYQCVLTICLTSFILPVCLTSFILPVCFTSFILPVCLTSVSYQCVLPMRLTNASYQCVLPMHLTSVSY